jgi:hypothetical protein
MRSEATAAYGEIRDAAIAVRGDRIAWVGRLSDLPAGLHANRTIDGPAPGSRPAWSTAIRTSSTPAIAVTSSRHVSTA